MANASQARSEHGLGVANLVLRRVQLSTKRVSTRWGGREALMLTSTPYRSGEALIADAQWASVRTLTVSLSGNQGLWAVRDRSRFDDLSQRVRDLHEDQVYSIIEVVVRAMESWAQLQDTLATADAPAYSSLREDVERIANSLVFDGFIAATPIERLRLRVTSALLRPWHRSMTSSMNFAISWIHVLSTHATPAHLRNFCGCVKSCAFLSLHKNWGPRARFHLNACWQRSIVFTRPYEARRRTRNGTRVDGSPRFKRLVAAI